MFYLIERKPYHPLPESGRLRSRRKKYRLRKNFWRRWIHKIERQAVRSALRKGVEPIPVKPLGIWFHYI